jgi:hypothetical protein
MLHIFAMVFKCFLGIFASVSDACLKCFIYLLLYVATIAFRCFKSRSSVHWDARGKRPAAQTTFGAAWAMSRVAQDHYWCAPSRVQRVRCSFAPCANSIRTLAPRSDVANPI